VLAIGQIQIAVLIQVANIAQRGPALRVAGTGRFFVILVILEFTTA